jgi:DNA-binding beta-propeller fold protein YncE
VRTLVACAVVLTLAGATAAAGERGGSIRAFVTVAGGSRLAVVDVGSRTVVARIPLAEGSQSVAATIDGSRVLVVSPARGMVTQIDGIAATVSHVFGGFARPVGVAMALNGSNGFVRSRYAYVTEEERGVLDVLDLTRGRVIFRLGVGPRPTRLASSGAQLWVAHRRSRVLTVVDLSNTKRPSVADRIDAGGVVADLTAGDGIYVLYARSGVVGKIETPVSGRLLFRRRLDRRLGHIATDSVGRIWVTEPAGARATIASRGARIVRRVAVPKGPSAVAPVAGWMGVVGNGILELIDVPAESSRVTIPVGAGTRGLAFAVG